MDKAVNHETTGWVMKLVQALAAVGLLLSTGPALAGAPPAMDSPIMRAHNAVTAEIAALLKSPSPTDVARGLRMLQGVPAPGLEDALAAAASHPAGELSSVALDLLAQTGSPLALPLLEAALRSGDPARVSVASVWLPRYGDAGVAVAARLVDAPEPVTRHAAVTSLAHFPHSARVKEVLERAAHHADSGTARVAAFALADANY